MRRATCLILPFLVVTARAEARPLTVEEALAIAKSASPRLQSADEQSLAAHDEARGVRGRLLPSVHVSEVYERWDSAFATPIGANGSPAVLRDVQTSTVVASVEQPIVGLLRLNEDYRSAGARGAAADARSKTAQADVAQAVETFFLRYFEARATEDIARASETELQDQVTVAQARMEAGVLTTADVLRAQVALANARQQEIFAHSQGDVVRAQLFGVMGIANDAGVELVEPHALLNRAATILPVALDAERTAVRARPEVVELDRLTAAADHHRRALTYALLPDVDVEGAYLRTDGQTAPPNQEVVRLRVRWTVWEWGASWYQMRAARHAADAQRLQLADTRRQVVTDVESRLSESAAAASAVDIAKRAIASAEEAFRVTNAQVSEGAATTTDLLDAQSALTSARLNFARARYELAIARVALARAMGE